MTRLDITAHAAQRLQQRAIPIFVVELLLEHGTPSRCGDADRFSFDRIARDSLADDLNGVRNMKDIERWLDVYAVVGDNARLVTAAHKTKRRRRH